MIHFFNTPISRESHAGIPAGPAGRRKDFPIDIVYTWVDQSDPAWLAKRQKTMASMPHESGMALCRDGIREREFQHLAQLKFSLRSVSRYAGFIRKVFIVTDDQIPEWLNLAHPKIEMISHLDIFGTTGRLPTFNSHAIESRLHHIPGLAEHFLYFNDDFLLGKPVRSEDFFEDMTISKFFQSPLSNTPITSMRK